jgi:hypothetical protein
MLFLWADGDKLKAFDRIIHRDGKDQGNPSSGHLSFEVVR